MSFCAAWLGPDKLRAPGKARLRDHVRPNFPTSQPLYFRVITWIAPLGCPVPQR